MSTGRRRTANTSSFPRILIALAPHIETAIARVPAFGEVGVKKVYNGAIAYTPDGSPIVGPAPGVRNFWLNEGHSFGVTAAGGAGWQLAEWIVEGEPTIDMLGVDPRRFGPYADTGYLIEKNEEAYAKVFTVHYPDEERVGRAPAAPDALLCADEGPRRRVRFRLRLGAAELVRAARLRLKRGGTRQARCSSEREPSPCWLRREAAREMELPPFELFPIRRRRVSKRARQRRPHGHVGLRQMRGVGSRRGKLAQFHPHQPRAEGDRPRHPELSSHRTRRRAGGVYADAHRAGAILSHLRRSARDA